MKRSGFTMIELIFVIVILGILAAVAIPKLAATRNDAKIAAEMTNISQVINNLGAEFTSQGTWTNTNPALESAGLKCFFIDGALTPAQVADGNFTINPLAAATTSGVCPSAVYDGVIAKATANGILGANGVKKEYSFGGIGVVE